MSVSSPELLGLVDVCKLNTLALYATFLSELIHDAQKDPKVYEALKGMRQIAHTGVAINKDDEDWAYANGLNIIVSAHSLLTGHAIRQLIYFFDSARMGQLRLVGIFYFTILHRKSPHTPRIAQLLRSRYGNDAADRALRPIPGVSVTFLPQSGDNTSVGVHEGELYEAVVPPGTDDCPPPSLCEADGYYHTGDLFERSFDGWVYRGRAGDWIKILPGFCDTK